MLVKILQKYLWYASKQVARRSNCVVVHAKISVYVLSTKGPGLTLIPCMVFAHFVPNDRWADLNKC